ncbi:kinase/pyrophosphorylase [bacterium AH-315-P15]|nr:kinase/pyrophosphorylase [bacterium AH-315-P15]
MNEKTAQPFHVHLISDATGETLASVAKAACVQFDMADPIEHIYALVRTGRQLERALVEVETVRGIVMFTMMNEELRVRLETRCRELAIPCVAVLDAVLDELTKFLGAEQTHRTAGQHQMDEAYFDRIAALNYTMAHDDGQNAAGLGEADVILIGVSRTSKTPTSIYLANRGVKAANIPLVPGVALPEELDQVEGPLIIGLTVSADRLIQVRRNRLLSLKEKAETDYTDPDLVKREVVEARRIFTRAGWPVIDVSRRSIEETAASALNLLHDSKARL